MVQVNKRARGNILQLKGGTSRGPYSQARNLHKFHQMHNYSMIVKFKKTVSKREEAIVLVLSSFTIYGNQETYTYMVNQETRSSKLGVQD